MKPDDLHDLKRRITVAVDVALYLELAMGRAVGMAEADLASYEQHARTANARVLSAMIAWLPSSALIGEPDTAAPRRVRGPVL